MLALPFQKTVVTASRLFGELTAESRATFVNRAVPIFLIEKDASAFENVIFAMLQYASLVILFVLREFLFGLFVSQAEVFGQSLNVAFVDSDPVVRTAITRTFGAVVFQPRLFRCRVPIRL